jgi:hypothetical protein
MRNVAMIASCLLASVAPLWAQQNGKDKPGDSSKPGAAETCEIRAYLLNKERGAVGTEGITAVLVIEGKDGSDRLIPLERVTPKSGEKKSLHATRPPREVEGTAYFATLITVHPDGSRRSEGDDADRRLAQGLAQDLPADSDKNRFTLDGPYFKANLNPEQLGAFTCQASVRFTIDGVNHTARGFSCALSKGNMKQGALCQRIADECHLIERHLKANEMDKAGVVADRLAASLCEPCCEPKCDLAQHGCKSCCKNLRAAISSGACEKALEALEALKVKCSSCLGNSKAESKPDVEKK